FKTNEAKLTLTQQEMYQDLDVICMKKLKERFENKCYNSGLILEVIEIMHRSCCVINNNDPRLSGNVSVKFKTKSVFYPQRSIIFIKISSINSDDIRGHSKYVVATLRSNRLMNNIKENFILPFVVSTSRYSPGQSKIECYGCEFNYWFDPGRKPLTIFYLPNMIYKVVPLSKIIFNNPSKTPNELIDNIKYILKEFIDELKKEEKKNNILWKQDNKKMTYFSNIIDINSINTDIKQILNKSTQTGIKDKNIIKNSSSYFKSKSKIISLIDLLENYVNNLPNIKGDKVNNDSTKSDIYNQQFITKPFTSPNNNLDIHLYDEQSLKEEIGLNAHFREEYILTIAAIYKNNYIASNKLIRKMAKTYVGEVLKTNAPVFTLLNIHKANLLGKIEN
ncbi:MAG: hypothetical protein KIT69_14240, partial [Propionibacteriaceae bacterium]|nr:hypothetical protein [Propionibacteriaceae bacterium]